MTHQAPISRKALYEILSHEFSRLKTPACRTCKPAMPRRLGDGTQWSCQLQPCEHGCHRKFDFLTRLLSHQYRLRDLADTLA